MSMRHKGIKEDCKSERFTHSNLFLQALSTFQIC